MRNKNGLRFKHYNYEGKQSNGTRNMKNINFVPEDIQGILSSPKTSEGVMMNGMYST